MGLETAPFHTDVAHGPGNGAAHWLRTSDGFRVRIGHWAPVAARGTVLIFPGRTEYIEKYGQIAGALAARGFASMAIDWRGQGLSDRMLDDPLVGHVDKFSDYQKDVAALLAAARDLALPQPYFLLAHSMGGAIGLRSLMTAPSSRAVVFSGPMWGLQIKAHVRAAAWVLSHLMPRIGHGHRLPPGSRLDHHILVDPFEGNLLTRDREQFEIMRGQLQRYPELVLGGPSLIWLREALREMHRLSRSASPDVPCLTLLGSNERIVDIPAIHSRMARWPTGHLEIVPGGEHEVLMEGKEITDPLFDRIAEHFRAATD